MPNSSLSHKSKPLPRSKSQAVSHSDEQSQAKMDEGARELSASKSSAPPPEAEAPAKLAFGAKLLAQALSPYAIPQDPKARLGISERHDFKAAYSSMLQAIPLNNRKVVLHQMKADLELAATELNAAPAEHSAVGITRKVSTAEFMAGLERQEKDQREDDLASGKLIPGSELRARLKVSPQALSAALKAKRMFVMQGPSGEYAYPAFFADNAFDRPVLEKVCKALGDLPGSSKWDFFMAPRTSLGGKSPLGALAKGQVEAVMRAANAFVEE
jgi:hypothetical protein